MEDGLIRAVRIAGVIVIGIAAAFAIYYWTFIPLRCAHAAWHGSRALDAAEPRGEYVLRRAASDVRASLRGCDCAPTHELYFTLGGADAALNDPRAAVADYQRALDVDRRPETYFELGMNALDALDRPLAIDSFTRACEFNPARLAEIPYDDVRIETARRVRAAYGDGWLR